MIWEATLPGPQFVKLRQRSLRKTYLDYKEEKGHEWPPINGGVWDEYKEEWEDPEHEKKATQARRSVCRRSGKFSDNKGPFWDTHMLGLDTNTPAPSITFVCREANNVVLSRYTKAFSYSDNLPGTLFDFDTDTLYLQEDFFSHRSGYYGPVSITEGLAGHYAITDTTNVVKVRRLALYLSDLSNRLNYDWNFFQTLEAMLCRLLGLFSGVTELSLLIRDYNMLPTPGYLPDLMGQGHLIDAIDVPEAIGAYSTWRTDLLNRTLPLMKPLKNFNGMEMELFVDSFKRNWGSFTELGTSRQVPNVQVKSLVPTIMKRDLDRAKSLYESAQVTYDRVAEEQLRSFGFSVSDFVSDDDDDF